MKDAIFSDDLWLVVKSLSNSAIAGSPRNIFRYSLWQKLTGGRDTGRIKDRKITRSYQTPNASVVLPRSQTVGAKFHGRKGNNPDRRLRSPISA